MKDIGDSGDWIIQDKSIKYCPRAQCVYNKLMNSNKNICKYIKDLDISKNTTVLLKMADTGFNSGFTEYNTKTGITTITLDEDYCSNKEPYQDYLLARTMTHELVHAKIIQTLVEAGYNPNEIKGYKNLYKNYGEYLEWFYSQDGANGVQHEIMLNISKDIELIAKTMFDLFGHDNQTYKDFMCGASTGLLELVSDSERVNFNNKYCKNAEGYSNYTLNCSN